MNKFKLLKWLFFLLYVGFSLGVPIYLINNMYGLYLTDVDFYIIAGGFVVLVIIAKFFWNHFKTMITYMQPGFIRAFSERFMSVMPLFLLWVILIVVRKNLDNVTHIVKWSAFSNTIGIIFYILYIHYKLKARELK